MLSKHSIRVEEKIRKTLEVAKRNSSDLFIVKNNNNRKKPEEVKMFINHQKYILDHLKNL